MAKVYFTSVEQAAEFQHLCDMRELMLLNLVGVVQHAVGNLNLNDPPAAIRTLMRGLELYNEAQCAIEQFHLDQKRKQISPESQSAAKEAA